MSQCFSEVQQRAYSSELKNGADELNFPLDDGKIAAFLQYLALFHKWNKTYNLSAIRNPDEMPAKHILDSLSVISYIHGSRFVDVGTGPGLPGIPLAIMFPDKQFTLLDSNGKKTRFLFQVVQSLGLKNVDIVNERVENYREAEPFDGIVCRAYSSIAGIVNSVDHLLSSNGKIWAMKGLIPTDELRELEKHYIVDAIHALHVPGVEGERNLVVLARRN